MSTAARSPQPQTARPDPDDSLGAKESQMSPTAPGRPSPEQIAREAYLIYLASGSVDGRHDDHWHEAERRLSSPSGGRQGDATPQQAAAQLDDVDTRDRTPG